MAWKMLGLSFLLAARATTALSFASTQGSYLINNATGGTITMNGIWYSLSNSTTDVNAMDSLKDGDACRRDATLMANVGINTIYVMAIDPQENHDDCFSIFNSVGIYVIVTLRKEAIFQSTYTELANSYSTGFFQESFKIIDAVKDYENLLGFDLGHLPIMGFITNDAPNLTYAGIEKIYRGMIRDTKEYIARHALRPILVGATLNLRRTDERIEASDLTRSHAYWLSCTIDDDDKYSRTDYISFWNLGYWETYPLEKQSSTYSSLKGELEGVDVPVWYSMYGVSTEADYVEYVLRPELVDDTLYLYNSSSQIIYPYGPMAGGARFTWTNRNLGWKAPISNWGIVVTDADGNVQLTPNYDRLQEIFSRMNTGSWLSGETGLSRGTQPGSFCNASLMENTTLPYADGDTSTLTIATDWTLPTRPAEVDAMVTSGVNGKRGQMVDVTITTLIHTVKDSKGSQVMDLVLKPSKSQSRPMTTFKEAITSTASSENYLSTGAKAGIGVGAAVGGLSIIALAGLLLLRRRKSRKLESSTTGKGQMIDQHNGDVNGFAVQKAELATGAEVERNQAELSAQEKPPQEVHAFESRAEAPSVVPQPVELPANERAQELSSQQDTQRHV